MKNRRVTDVDEIILMAVLRQQGNAYGVSIQKTIAERTGRNITFGVMYSALDGLEAAGFVRSRLGEPTAERGGRAKRYFKITAAGMKALNQNHQERAKMLEGLDTGGEPMGAL